MKIALLGYGKMGKAIEQIALERNHQIVLKTTSKTDTIDLSNADVAIDFSIPKTAYSNILEAFNQRVPIISGTTGWLDKYNDVVQQCKGKEGAFIYASNFSLGVNIFFEINKQLAKLMANYSDYSVEIEEIHHTEKLDAPSGTAITLANQILGNFNKDKWVLGVTEKENELPIIAKRIENVAGTHHVKYESDIDEIEIIHKAKNRKGFALGAVIAAEWIKNKKGVYTMADVLGINQ
jgi:4-hydroxy-tetrahydrodipicolinate reductase